VLDVVGGAEAGQLRVGRRVGLRGGRGRRGAVDRVVRVARREDEPELLAVQVVGDLELLALRDRLALGLLDEGRDLAGRPAECGTSGRGPSIEGMIASSMIPTIMSTAIISIMEKPARRPLLPPARATERGHHG
jgi:hypothetical protein